jgi:hypothetical protein
VQLTLTPTTVEVHLTTFEKVGAVRRDFSIRRDAVTAAEVVPDPIASMRGHFLRIGIRIPGVMYVCTTDRGRHFWAIRRHTRAVHLEVTDGPGRLREVTISHREPEQVVAELNGGG